MTPIKCFRFLLNAIYTEDWAGCLELVAVAPSDGARDFLLASLSRAHSREVLPMLPALRVPDGSFQPNV